jgi:hypothetical protein
MPWMHSQGLRRNLLPVIAKPAGGWRRERQEQALLRADDRAFSVHADKAGRLRPDETGGADARLALRIDLSAPHVGEAGAETGAGDLPPSSVWAVGRLADSGGDRALGVAKLGRHDLPQVALQRRSQFHNGRASTVQTSRSASRIDPIRPAEDRANGKARVGTAGPPQRIAGESSKEALLIDILRRPEGATIAQIMAATGWQAHTVRGAFASALKKKRGLIVTSEKPDNGERFYRIAG